MCLSTSFRLNVLGFALATRVSMIVSPSQRSGSCIWGPCVTVDGVRRSCERASERHKAVVAQSHNSQENPERTRVKRQSHIHWKTTHP
eukprot:6594621-Prymnesium_polylepis.2